MPDDDFGQYEDNRENLGEEVIAGLEEDYPPGYPRRRTLLEGTRGIAIDGKPCYEGYYDSAIHEIAALAFNPYYPLLEGWDFSHAPPAVLGAQQIGHTGALHILGGVQGFDMFLEGPYSTLQPCAFQTRSTPVRKPGSHDDWMNAPFRP